MKSFEKIAKLIRTHRLDHPKGYTQVQLSELLGYKNGQFISNVERAMCGVPLKKMPLLCKVLSIPPEKLKAAILADKEDLIKVYLERIE